MKLNRSTGYAFLAMCYIAKNNDKKPILSNTVSQEYNIPLEYLLKLMQYLSRANILRSKRGPRGGFTLARPANKITMLEIIEAVEGPFSNDLLLSEVAPKDKFCIKAEKVNEKAVAQARAVYKNAKLSDLI